MRRLPASRGAEHRPLSLSMARPEPNLPAEAWGRLIAGYGRWITRQAQVVLEGELPAGAFIAVSWHCTNLLVMGVHAEKRPHPYRAFVPPGLLGQVMRGSLKAYGMEPIALPPDGCGNPVAGLKEMARALKDGWAAGIALDGPHGPARTLRPGALWLARLSGRPLIVIGAAARPAVRAPWWDRHLIALPHAKIALVYGEPIMIERSCEISPALCSLVTDSLNAAEARAWDLVRER
jgi:lysophospholipid acyltransferase (LPLAT)-like uncharacterized protein